MPSGQDDVQIIKLPADVVCYVHNGAMIVFGCTVLSELVVPLARGPGRIAESGDDEICRAPWCGRLEYPVAKTAPSDEPLRTQ